MENVEGGINSEPGGFVQKEEPLFESAQLENQFLRNWSQQPPNE